MKCNNISFMLTQTSQEISKTKKIARKIGNFPSPLLYPTDTVVRLMETHQNHMTVPELPNNK